MSDQNNSRIFEEARPRLMGLAYRILGSVADAEDAVQETYVRWLGADISSIKNPGGWLTTVCTRYCIDLLKSAQRTRLDYVGTWLPEPITAEVDENIDVEAQMDLASSLSTAFLLLLERLSPKERAAYLLHELFDTQYDELAETLSMTEPACRKLVSRAKANLKVDRRRFNPRPEAQARMLSAFQNAITSGSSDRLEQLLAEDVQLGADGGGKVIAALNIIDGKDKVLRFIKGILSKAWSDLSSQFTEFNGAPALLITEGETITAVVGCACDTAGAANRIYIVRNPDKLALTNRRYQVR